MEKRKHMQAFRHIVQASYFALTNGYVQGVMEGKIYQGRNKRLCVPGLNCYSCPGALNSCPIGSLQAVLNSRQFNVSCYVFGIMMMFGAAMGRFVCGWLCPFGLVQDLLYKIPFVKKKKNLPGHKYLTKLKYVILAVFVLLLSALVKDVTGLGQPWFCEYICPSGTLLAGIPLVILNPGLRAAIGFKFLWKIIVLLFIMALSIVYYRPFCKYLCPLGAVYGVFNPISFYRYQVDREACVECGACQKACGMDIKVWENPNSVECIRCGKCRTACPTHAITSTTEKLRGTFQKKCVSSLQSEPVEKVMPFKVVQMISGVLFLLVNLFLVLMSILGSVGMMYADDFFIGKTIFSSMLYYANIMVGVCSCLTALAASGVWLSDKGDGVRLLKAYWIQKHVTVVVLLTFVLSFANLNYNFMFMGMPVCAGAVILLILMKLLIWKMSKNVHTAEKES